MNNFSPRAQQATILARKEAVRLSHDYVGTEHLLFAILNLDSSVACKALEVGGQNRGAIKARLEKEILPGKATAQHSLPYTPRIKKVFALAEKEAKGLKHDYVGTEHLLLGLIYEDEGAAACVLKSFGVELESLRGHVLTALESKSKPNHDPDFKTLYERECVTCAALRAKLHAIQKILTGPSSD